MLRRVTPEKIQKYFYLSQIGLGFLGITAAWLMFRPKTGSSQFKTREADLKKSKPSGPDSGLRLEDARLEIKGFEEERRRKEKQKATLSLPGVRTDGTPHEVLGIAPGATEQEILKAYRDLMKRYHPDKVAPAGTPAWKDAQAIAESLNRAKDALIQKK